MEVKSYSEETIIKNPFKSQSSIKGERLCWMAWEEGHKAGLQAGRKEVVEFVKKVGIIAVARQFCDMSNWESKLEEWKL